RTLVPRAEQRGTRVRRPDLSDDRRRRRDGSRGSTRVSVAADLGIAFGRVLFVMMFVLNVAAILGWVERKQSAIMQDRIGAIGASIMGVIMVYGSLNMMEIVRGQGQLLWGWLPKWGIITQPLAFILFVTAGIATTKRIPFDMPEGESEIIGYNVEYSGMKFGMFAMADFLETVVVAGLTTSLFIGGWQVPYLYDTGFRFPWGSSVGLPHLLVALLQVGAFSFKVVVMIFIMMLIRWTLPRFRYDQAMRLGWLGLFPLSILNIVLTGAVLLAWGSRP